MSNQGIGNINYSFDKKKYREIISKNIFIFEKYYIITMFISFFFLTGSFILNGTALSEYKKTDEDDENREYIDRKALIYFSEFCLGSPFKLFEYHEDGILEKLTEEEIEEEKNPITYIGFTQNSYILLIITNLIGIFILIEALLKNLMSSIIVNYVQVNKENNPYKNPNCITKIDEEPIYYINKNYSRLTSLSFLFIIPFLTPFFLKFINLDRYDIKKTQWIKYYIFLSLIFPTVILLVYRLTGHSSITLFDTIDKFIQNKDKEYINFMKQMFNLKFFIIFTFLFIFIIFLCLQWIYGSINKTVTGYTKYFYYFIVIVSIYFVIPAILSTNAVSTLYNVFKENNIDKSESETIKNLETKGVQSLYDLIVKYNYPCFKK